MTASNFYQLHLDRVSRSFAFCIARLEEPLKEWVGLSYLLCRVLDTVEDAPWESATEQLSAFEEFDRWLEQVPTREQVDTWVQLFPKSIPEGELLLLHETHRLLEDLHHQPDRARAVILRLAQEMSLGMQRFQSQEPKNRLRSLTEVNQYCFFVAGLVGEALTHLLELVCEDFKASAESIADAHHFGLFLQKVNLLKDQSDDERQGRFLVPDRGLVLQSVSENAKGAFRFLMQLPKNQRGFRLFCAWSFFLGLATLPIAQKAFLRGKQGKLPRTQTLELISEVEDLQEVSAEKLEPLFLSLSQKAGLQVSEWALLKRGLEAENRFQTPQWLTDIYRGSLKKSGLYRLGVLEQ